MNSEPSQITIGAILPSPPSRSQKKRVEIIHAVIDSVSSVGIHETSADPLGKRLKMSRSHVAYYFPRWEDLIEHSIRYVIGGGQRCAA